MEILFVKKGSNWKKVTFLKKKNSPLKIKHLLNLFEDFIIRLNFKSKWLILISCKNLYVQYPQFLVGCKTLNLLCWWVYIVIPW